jgi:hypothetical protein
VNESAVADVPAAVPDRRGRTFARSRLVLEFGLLFIGTMAAKELLAITGAVSFPNLLWLPVAVLTLQNGLGSALAAAIIASGLQYVGGLPPELLGEDIYSYIGRIAAEPIAWTGFALIFGHIRSRQIAHAAELQAQLAERTEQCAAVAGLCDDLRRRLEALERQIAAAGQLTDADAAQAIIELHQAGWDDFTERLRRFLVLMTGCPEFTIHLLRADALIPAFQPADDHRSFGDGPILCGDALFEAVVKQGRTLSARRAADSTVLAGRAVMAGPLRGGRSPAGVIGMLSIGGASPDDCSDDLDRRFSLVLSELSRLTAHLMLIERWQAATAGISNGHGTTREAQLEFPDREEDHPLEAPPAKRDAQVALQ